MDNSPNNLQTPLQSINSITELLKPVIDKQTRSSAEFYCEQASL